MTGTGKTFTKHYTMVELLVVLFVVGILLAISAGGIGRLLGRQGASGAVRNISSNISLARSYAVMKNTYVAFLLPDDNTTTSSFNSTDLKWHRYSRARICLAKNYNPAGTAEFVGWLDGNDWDIFPSGTCGYINAGQISITNITDLGGVKSTAILFKPNGTLATGTDASIKIFMAKYIPTNPIGKELVYETKSEQGGGWEISVNAFTGRSDYEKKSN